MRCEEVSEYMQRDLDHDLNDEEQRKLRDHLAFCEECTVIYERLKKLSDELEQLPDVKPAYSIVDAIIPQLDMLDGRTAPSVSNEGRRILPFPRGQRFNWKWISGTVAAGLIMAIWVANAPLNQSKDSASEATRSNNTQPASEAQQSQINAADSQAMQKAAKAPMQSENDQMPAASDQGFTESMKQGSAAMESGESARSAESADAADLAEAPESASMLMAPDAPSSNEENAETSMLFTPSPTGQYTANTEQPEKGVKQIVIRDQQGQPIFISHQFSQDINVSYEWAGDEVLIYHLMLPGQDSSQMETWEIYLQNQGAASYERKQP